MKQRYYRLHDALLVMSKKEDVPITLTPLSDDTDTDPYNTID